MNVPANRTNTHTRLDTALILQTNSIKSPLKGNSLGDAVRLDLEAIMRVYEERIDSGDVDNGNLFIALLTGFLAFVKYHGVVDEAAVSEFARELRIRLIEGPDYLNPYVMELLGILEEEVDENSFYELITKLRALLREERLDRLEV